MKYGNFYDLESLTLLNRHEGCACSIKECDVEKVKLLVLQDSSAVITAQPQNYIEKACHRHPYHALMLSRF